MTRSLRDMQASPELIGEVPRVPLDGAWILVKTDAKLQETLSLKSLPSTVPLQGGVSQPEREAESMKPSPLLKIPAVAGLLSMSKSKVHELVRTGDIPSVRIDKCVRVRQSDLEAFIEDRLTSRPMTYGGGNNG